MNKLLAVVALLLIATPVQAKPEVRGYVGPNGFFLEFGKKPRREKCRTHTHWRGNWSLRHNHCISRDRSWRRHKRNGHRRYY